MGFGVDKIIVACLALLFLWMVYRQGGHQPEGEEWIMRFPTIMVWLPALMILMLLLPSYGVTVSYVHGTLAVAEFWPVVIFLLMILLVSFALLLDWSWRHIKLTPRQIVDHSPWRRRRSIQWDEVSSVYYSRWMQSFGVRDCHGTVIRISPFMVGRRRFITEVCKRLPESSYASATAEFDFWGR